MRYQRGFVALDVKIALVLGLVLGALFISAVVRPLYAYKEASDIQRAVDVISQGAARYYSEQILTTGCLAYSGTVDVARLVAGRFVDSRRLVLADSTIRVEYVFRSSGYSRPTRVKTTVTFASPDALARVTRFLSFTSQPSPLSLVFITPLNQRFGGRIDLNTTSGCYQH